MPRPRVTNKMLEEVAALGPLAALVVATLRHQRVHLQEVHDQDGKYERQLRSLQREFDKLLAENARLRSLADRRHISESEHGLRA